MTYESWDWENTPTPQGAGYLSWMKEKLFAGFGVVQFVLCKGDRHNSYGPAYDPVPYDHIEPFFKMCVARAQKRAVHERQAPAANASANNRHQRPTRVGGAKNRRQRLTPVRAANNRRQPRPFPNADTYVGANNGRPLRPLPTPVRGANNRRQRPADTCVGREEPAPKADACAGRQRPTPQTLPFPARSRANNIRSNLPNSFPRYSKQPLNGTEVRDDDIIVHGSDYSPDGADNLGYFRTFDSLLDDKKMEGNCADAGDGYGKNEMYPCIYDFKTYGTAITGVQGVTPDEVPVAVLVDTTDEPDVREDEAPTPLTATVIIDGDADEKFTVYRFDGGDNFPAGDDFSGATSVYEGVSTGGWVDPNTFMSNTSVMYRAIKA